MFGNKNINAYFCERYMKGRLRPIVARVHCVLLFDIVGKID